jgi:AbrB family looped-hinge helix DNA binding protein
MSMLTITAKGQVTLRKDLMNHLGVQPGDRVSVDKLPDGGIEVRAVNGTGRIADVFDLLKGKSARRLSIKQMGEVAAKGWAGKR